MTKLDSILEILKDGEYHSKDEIADIIGCNKNNLAVHMCLARKKLDDEGVLIICEYVKRATGYRMVRKYGDIHAPFEV